MKQLKKEEDHFTIPKRGVQKFRKSYFSIGNNIKYEEEIDFQFKTESHVKQEETEHKLEIRLVDSDLLKFLISKYQRKHWRPKTEEKEQEEEKGTVFKPGGLGMRVSSQKHLFQGGTVETKKEMLIENDSEDCRSRDFEFRMTSFNHPIGGAMSPNNEEEESSRDSYESKEMDLRKGRDFCDNSSFEKSQGSANGTSDESSDDEETIKEFLKEPRKKRNTGSSKEEFLCKTNEHHFPKSELDQFESKTKLISSESDPAFDRNRAK